jgi:hypothetical protein
VVYRGDPAICDSCPVKSKCTTSDRGRTIQRSLYEDYLEKVRGYHTSEVYKKAICKRQVWVEPMFAEAKEWHGLRRLRLRGLMNANIQGFLIASGQNLKRFLAVTGWGRKHAPCGSLLARPREPGSRPSTGNDCSGLRLGQRRANLVGSEMTAAARKGFFSTA